MAITTFTAAQVLTAAQMNAVQSNDFNQTVSTKTASYTLVAADKGTRVVMNAAGATTITVNTSLFSAGDTLVLQNIGAGACTVTAGTATVSSAGPLAIPQNGSGTLYFTSAGVSIFYPSAGPAASSALTRLGGGTLTGNSVSFTNAFSATYDNYLITVGNMNRTSSGHTRLAMTGGTNHQYNSMNNQNGGVFASGDSANTSAFWTYGYSDDSVGTIRQHSFITVLSPFLTTSTGFFAQSLGYPGQYMYANGNELSATSFTGFAISLNGANTFSSGIVNFYGYTNS